MTQSIPSQRSRRGQSMLEFTFVGIPIMFVLISIFEISRGMWMYHTLAFSVKDGVRFAAVHGINCVKTTTLIPPGSNPNDCPTSIAAISAKIRDAAVIFDTTKASLTFFPGDGGVASTTCKMVGVGGTDCPQLTATWPPFDATAATTFDAVGQPIRIDVTAPFQSALSMFWPGSRAVKFGTFTLGASSTDFIQY